MPLLLQQPRDECIIFCGNHIYLTNIVSLSFRPYDLMNSTILALVIPLC